MTRLKKEILGPWHKRLLYGVCALLWLSGTVWLYLRYGTQVRDGFGPQVHPAQAIVLKLHGATAMVFLVIFGTLLYHIPPGWRKKQQRPSGVSLMTVCGILILTGGGLYYVGDDQLRNLTSVVHSVVGILFPLIVFLHVWRIIRRRAKRNHGV